MNPADLQCSNWQARAPNLTKLEISVMSDVLLPFWVPTSGDAEDQRTTALHGGAALAA